MLTMSPCRRPRCRILCGTSVVRRSPRLSGNWWRLDWLNPLKTADWQIVYWGRCGDGGHVLVCCVLKKCYLVCGRIAPSTSSPLAPVDFLLYFQLHLLQSTYASFCLNRFLRWISGTSEAKFFGHTRTNSCT